MNKIKKETNKFFKSFTFAFKGILFCISNERNMRVHISVAMLVLIFAYFFNLTVNQYAILILTFAIVIACEMINTAIEILVNMNSPNYSVFAKIAKDIAAGAVFISALGAIGVGICFFLDFNKLILTFQKIIFNPFYVIFWLLLILLSLLFIYKGDIIVKKYKNIH